MENRSRHDRVKDAFYEACLLQESERERFLTQNYASDEELRGEVVALLRFYGAPTRADRSLRVSLRRLARKRRLRKGEIFAGRYRIERHVGQGGMGEVYAAYDRVLGVTVALKKVEGHDDAQKRRLAGEVRLARQIAHPGVCRIYDIGEHAGVLFLTMELIEGQDLGTRLARSGRLPSGEVVAIGVSLCEALAAAHQAGVLHLDLKPANILIDREGSVHITDFGIARSLTGGGPESDRESSELFGTPAYLAPEWGTAPPTERTDLYSLGLVLYELTTGSLPFPATDPSTLRELHRSVPPERPSRLVPEIDPLLEECLLRLVASDPALRPFSATVVGEELARIRPLQQPAETARGERRPITLLRCDLLTPPVVATVDGGSLAGARSLEGPSRDASEDSRTESRTEEAATLRARCAAVCLRYGGRIVRHLDQGLLVQFRLPACRRAPRRRSGPCRPANPGRAPQRKPGSRQPSRCRSRGRGPYAIGRLARRLGRTQHRLRSHGRRGRASGGGYQGATGRERSDAPGVARRLRHRAHR